jgi:hypothetical protein
MRRAVPHPRPHEEVEVRFQARVLELRQILAIVLKHHEIHPEKHVVIVVHLELVPQFREKPAILDELVEILQRCGGKRPAFDGSIVKFEPKDSCKKRRAPGKTDIDSFASQKHGYESSWGAKWS